MRVLLVDDHGAMRTGMKTLLGVTDDIEVAGEARDAEEAELLTRELKPDLVVLDLRLRGEAGGIEVCREIKGFPKPPLVLIHTSYNTLGDSALATLAGADGYLCKSVEDVGLPEAIRRVYTGKPTWLLGIEHEEAWSRLAEALKEADLTPREQEILPLLVRQYSDARIAKELYVGPETVRTHVKSILKKLGLKSRKKLHS
jgi:DNA-binding NarL/FixJ family response regulator